MTVDIRDPRFRDVVGDDVELEEIVTGCLFTEGPIWHPYEKHLTFSDMPDDHMRRWTPADGVKTFRRPSNKTNGNTYDAKGRMVSCEHSTSRVTRTELDGSITVLATHWQGKELNSPNDIVVGPDGTSLYFTDPTFGRMPVFGLPRECELDFRGVYRILLDGPGGPELQLLADDFVQPNGLCFSLDRKTLYVDDTDRGHIRAFDVGSDGKLSNGRVWATLTGEGEGAPDGMKVDGADNVYCTGQGGVHVFDPQAVCLGVIRVPQVTANFNWGDDDLRTIYFTASNSVYRGRVKTAGQKQF